MFICKDCIEKYEDGSALYFLGIPSRGRCEECHDVKVCADVHHSLLDLKVEEEDEFEREEREREERLKILWAQQQQASTEGPWKIEPHTMIDKSFKIEQVREDLVLYVDYDDVNHETVDYEIERMVRNLNFLARNRYID